MSYSDDELSNEDGQPREFYEISVGDDDSPATVYRVASGARDLSLTIGSVPNVLFVASPVARTEIAVAGVGSPKELTLILPVNHALVKRWMLYCSPPAKTLVTIRCLQVRSGEIETLFVGRISSLSVEGGVARFRVPSRVTETMLRVLPNVTAGKKCPHMLYDSMCRVNHFGLDPNGLAYRATTAVAVGTSGRDVALDLGSVNRRGDWAVGGELRHVPSGERMTVRSQVDSAAIPLSSMSLIQLQTIIPNMKVGDALDLFAGCDKTIETCETKFGNRHNFGGFNRMPTKNVWSPVDSHGKDVPLGELE